MAKFSKRPGRTPTVDAPRAKARVTRTKSKDNAQSPFEADVAHLESKLDETTHRSQIVGMLRASAASWSPETASFSLRRVLAITIYVDGDEADTNGHLLSKDAQEILEDKGFRVEERAGPEAGSYIITLFGSGEEPEDGKSLLEKAESICDHLLSKAQNLPWANIGKNGGHVLVIAGTTAKMLSVVVAPHVVGPVLISHLAIELGIMTDMISLGKEICTMLKKKP